MRKGNGPPAAENRSDSCRESQSSSDGRPCERIGLKDESRPLAFAGLLAMSLRLEIHRPNLSAQNSGHARPSATLISIEPAASALSWATRRDNSAIRSCMSWVWNCSSARRAYSDRVRPNCFAAASTPAAKSRGRRKEKEMRSSINTSYQMPYILQYSLSFERSHSPSGHTLTVTRPHRP